MKPNETKQNQMKPNKTEYTQKLMNIGEEIENFGVNRSGITIPPPPNECPAGLFVASL